MHRARNLNSSMLNTATPLHSRVYIDQEMYQPENQSPPLGDGHALAAIRAKARNYRRAGTDVGEILQASQRLAHAQVSADSSLSARLYLNGTL